MWSWFMNKNVVGDYLIDDGATGSHGELDVFVSNQIEVSGVSQTIASRWCSLVRWMPCLNVQVLIDGTFERGEGNSCGGCNCRERTQ